MDRILSNIIHSFDRFSPLEKILIFYGFCMLFVFIFVPIITIQPINNAESTSLFFLFTSGAEGFGLNKYFSVTSLIFLMSFALFLSWNLSFRFKNFLNNLIGLKGSEYILNFGLLRVMTSSLFSIGETTALLKHYFTYQMTLSRGYYFMSGMLLVGLVISLLYALKQARLLKGTPMITIVHTEEQPHQETPKEIKGLFKDLIKNTEKEIENDADEEQHYQREDHNSFAKRLNMGGDDE